MAQDWKDPKEARYSTETAKPAKAVKVSEVDGSWSIAINGDKKSVLKDAEDKFAVETGYRKKADAVLAAINAVDGPFVSGTITGGEDGTFTHDLVGRTHDVKDGKWVWQNN